MVAPKGYTAAGCSIIILASCLILDSTLEVMQNLTSGYCELTVMKGQTSNHGAPFLVRTSVSPAAFSAVKLAPTRRPTALVPETLSSPLQIKWRCR